VPCAQTINTCSSCTLRREGPIVGSLHRRGRARHRLFVDRKLHYRRARDCSAGANAHGQFGRETASETGPGSVIVPDTRGCGGFRVWERTRTRRCSSGDGTTMVTWRLGRLTTSRRLSGSGLRRPRKLEKWFGCGLGAGQAGLREFLRPLFT
jgi:hypothetical protein